MTTIREERQWISLGAACRILDVNQATLREWANRGVVKFFRTPGGHRRFLRDDVSAMTERGQPALAQQVTQHNEDMVLRRIRRRLQQGRVSHQAWYSDVDDAGRLRMRLFGRRLLSLLLQAASERRLARQVREEAHLLGMEHGHEMGRQRIGLEDTLAAFIFFRSSVMESATDQSRRRMGELADLVLLGIAVGYEGRHNGQSIHFVESS